MLERLRDDDEGALLAAASALGQWHRSTGFCSSCGAATEAARGGAIRRCVDEACGARFRPRLDASAIVLVASGERCLLGRKKAWPAGRYSTLAGFVDFGETVEECVVREVAEESGVRVRRDSLRYVASQQWLFPRSLMLGFIAEAEPQQQDQVRTTDTSGVVSTMHTQALPSTLASLLGPAPYCAQVRVQEEELEDVRWFDRAVVAAHLAEAEAGGDADGESEQFHVPSRVSLAHTILTQWVREGEGFV